MLRHLACLPLTLVLAIVCWPVVAAGPGLNVKTIKPSSSEQRSHPHPEEEDDSDKSNEQQEDESEDTKQDTTTESDTQQEANETTDSEKSKSEDEEKADPDDDKNDDKSDDKKEASKPKKPKPHKVESQPLEIDAELKGAFVAVDSHEVVLRPEVWTDFKVTEAVEHGAVVKKGDVLVKFDDEKIEKDLADEAIDQRLSELALMQLEEEFPREQRLREIAYEEARLAHDQLLEDYDYYRETDRPFIVRIAKYRYDSAKEDLASQEEELAQLEKMYAADDLTEETEEIVLRRQRFQVATARLSLELQEANHDYMLDVTLPRYDESYNKRIEQSELKLEQVKTAKEKGTIRAKYELEKKREARAKSIERHAKLVGDRSLMVIKAPADGVVYYGRSINGKWSEVTSMTSKLKPFGKVTANTVFMTVVSQRPLQVVAKVTEKELPDFKAGLPAEVIPAADDELALKGKVTAVHGVPDAGGKFAVEIDVDLDNAPNWLVAGMTCQANVTVYDKKSAIVIPSSLVQTDEDDDKQKYVMLLSEDDKPARKDVKLGRKKAKLVEVLSGLSAGDRIVKEAKKDQSKED